MRLHATLTCSLLLLALASSHARAGDLSGPKRMSDRIVVQLPVGSHCDDMDDDDIPSATQVYDESAQTANRFVYPTPLSFSDDGPGQEATCWFHLPSYFDPDRDVTLTVVGHTNDLIPGFGLGVDFDVRVRSVGADEDLGPGTWPAFQATLPGQLANTNIGTGQDTRIQTTAWTLAGDFAAGDALLMSLVRRVGGVRDVPIPFLVDYLLLSFGTKKDVHLVETSVPATPWLEETIEVMMPADVFCDGASGSGFDPAVLHDDETAITLPFAPDPFSFPQNALQFGTDGDERATCWFPMPPEYDATKDVQVTVVGHVPDAIPTAALPVDFKLGVRSVAEDEVFYADPSLTFIDTGLTPFSWTADSQDDRSLRTAPLTLPLSAQPLPGDVLTLHLVREDDDYPVPVNVDYLLLRFATGRAATFTCTSCPGG